MKHTRFIADSYNQILSNLPAIFCTQNDSWDYIDDRYKTFYGSTFEVVEEEYTVDSSFIDKIAIIGDKYLLTDNVRYFFSSYSSKYSDDYSDKYTNSIQYNSFYRELKKVYPNAIIDIIGDFSDTANTLNTLDNVVTYLKSNTPKFLIFNGAENGSYTDNVIKLKEIDNICKEKQINGLLVLTPQLKHLTSDIFSYQNMISSLPLAILKVLDMNDWFSFRFEISQLTAHIDENYINKCISDTSDEHYSYFLSNIDGYSSRYNVVVYNKIKRYVLRFMFKLLRKSFYISFFTRRIDADEYNNVCNFRSKTQESQIFGKQYYSTLFGDGGDSYEFDTFGRDKKNVYQIHFMTKYGHDNHLNLFCNQGNIIVCGIHTGYSDNLYMPQQLQVNCNTEYLYSREFSDIKLNRLMPIRKYHTGVRNYELGTVAPTLYPGTGCPWLTVSDSNKQKYSSFFNVTVVKDKFSYVLTVKLSVQGIKKLPDLWQSVTCGRVSLPVTSDYVHPLFAAGGNQALKQDIYIYTPVNGHIPTYLTGNVYDLDMDNICLSNSNLLHSTAFNGSTVSTFKLLSPEGIWRNIFSHSQIAHDVIPEPICEGNPYDFAYPLNPPTLDSSSFHNIFPVSGNIFNTCSLHHNDVLEPYLEKDDYSIIYPINIYFNNAIDIHDETLNIGNLPCCYYEDSNHLPSGDVVLNSVKYLAIPNGWDNRLLFYKWHYGVYNDSWEQEIVLSDFEDNNTFQDKLLIELGEEYDP